MSHNRDIIIQNLKIRASSAQKARLDEIEHRGKYTWTDRLYVAWIAYTQTGHE